MATKNSHFQILRLMCVPNHAAFQRLSPAAFKLYAALAISLDDESQTALPIAALADLTGMPPRTVSRALAQLRTYGLVVPTGEIPQGRARIPRYTLPLHVNAILEFDANLMKVVSQMINITTPPRTPTPPRHAKNDTPWHPDSPPPPAFSPPTTPLAPAI